ncbi:MAG: hypothetical protein Kow00121_54930 [Elainellaceae cyanobacterium]
MVNQRWVFIAHALDKPGTLTAAASVFSNRGVSLEAILGSGIAATTIENGRLILSFRATERKQIMLLRALERLSTISHVEVYRYDNPSLRAIAVAKVAVSASLNEQLPEQSPELEVEVLTQNETEQTVLFTGKTIAVETAIDQLRQQNTLQDVVMSVITI